MATMMNIDKTKPCLISLPRIYDPRGSLTFVQDNDQIPFEIARCYWTYDVPAGEARGGHSHKEAQSLLVAVNGCFNVNLFDGFTWMTYTLNRPFEGLYIPPGYWRTLDNFASGSVCLVMTSILYDPDEYVRDYEEFKRLAVESNRRL